MPIASCKDLDTYQLSMNLLVVVHQVSKTYPIFEQSKISRQLRRASKSIPANIAEGYGTSLKKNL